MAAPIVGSTFEANESQSEGGAISLVSSVSAVLANTLTANLAETDGAGIHVCVTCDPHASPYLHDNVVTGNLSHASDPTDGAAGVGAAYLGALQTNDVYGNLRDGQPSDFGWFNPVDEAHPVWVSEPVLTDVWWGTDDVAAIDAAVFDGADDPAYSLVTVGEARTGPIGAPVPRAVLASRRLAYTDPAETIPVFLTLYNPGKARGVLLTVTKAGQPFDGELAYPGAPSDDGQWTFVMPANSVWFTTLQDEAWTGNSDITWEATLTDAESGEQLGAVGAARYTTMQ